MTESDDPFVTAGSVPPPLASLPAARDLPVPDASEETTSVSSEGPAAGGAASVAASRRLVAGTARIATATGLRQILSVIMMGATAVTVARCLGPRDFGEYSGGTAAYNLIAGLVDLGFSVTLVREMMQSPDREGELLGESLVAQSLWSSLLTAALIVLGLFAGGPRGEVMLVLSPTVILSGLGVSRQIFSVRFRAAPLMILDISTTFAQCIIMVGLAVSHAPLVLLAINLGLWSVVTGVAATMMARKMVTFVAPSLQSTWAFVRAALPIGVASVLSSLYFTIDMTLLGFLVKPQALGPYASAVRVLQIVVTIPGFIMSAGLPGLSRKNLDREELSAFAATLAQWITVAALPPAIGLLLFARPVILILFGHAYLAAVPLIRVLMIAAVLSLFANLNGVVLVSQRIVRVQVTFNAISLAINIAGNLILVPHFGVIASAWLTVASELTVVSYGLFYLGRVVDYSTIFSQIWPSLLAVAVPAGIIVATGDEGLAGAGVFTVVYVIAMSLLRAWPSILTDWLRNRGLVR